MLSLTKSRLAGKTFLQTLFFFLLVTQICFAQWYQQNSGTNKNLRDVVFLNATTGIAVGDSGLILRTTDCGAFWSVVPTNVSNDLTSISFVDSENGWVAGNGAVILRTIDGGLNFLVDLFVPLSFRQRMEERLGAIQPVVSPIAEYNRSVLWNPI
jgi:photosystem II stability/assembly factor-like uncharacterized protein